MPLLRYFFSFYKRYRRDIKQFSHWRDSVSKTLLWFASTYSFYVINASANSSCAQTRFDWRWKFLRIFSTLRQPGNLHCSFDSPEKSGLLRLNWLKEVKQNNKNSNIWITCFGNEPHSSTLGNFDLKFGQLFAAARRIGFMWIKKKNGGSKGTWPSGNY